MQVFKRFSKVNTFWKCPEIHEVSIVYLLLKYTRWRHFGLAAIFKHQQSKISYIIARHFQNVFIYLNRLENAKTIGQKSKCTRWGHLGLAAILKRQTSEISYI
jgi:hypothetical protein